MSESDEKFSRAITRTVTVTLSERAAEYFQSHCAARHEMALQRAQIWANGDETMDPNPERTAHWTASAACWAADAARLSNALSEAERQNVRAGYDYQTWDVLQVKAHRAR